MRARAIGDLAQLSDADLFNEVAAGLELIGNHVVALEQDGRELAGLRRQRGSRILLALVEEEAAKYLILVDAVRCPRDPGERFAAHLRRFNDHLAKGLYRQASRFALTPYENFLDHLRFDRAQFYLDGPNDVDWIFRNSISDARERAMYVDYVATDEDHLWVAPQHTESDDDTAFAFPHQMPAIVEMATSLHQVGVGVPGALKLLADVWRPVEMVPAFGWHDLRELNTTTLHALSDAGLLREASSSTYSTIVNRWMFPLHSADLSLIKVDKNDLRRAQDEWVYDEMGVGWDD